MAVDGLAIDEIALKIGSCPVEFADTATVAGRVCAKRSIGAGATGSGPTLVEVNAGLPRATLDADASLASSITFAFENVDHVVHASTGRGRLARFEADPGLVARVIPHSFFIASTKLGSSHASA